MYRRDLLTAEIQKLAQVLARITGLKKEGRDDEAAQVFEENLHAFFSINKEALRSPVQQFSSLLETSGFDAARLDYLGQLMYLDFVPGSRQPGNIALAINLLELYERLETVHHRQSFQNLSIQQQLKTFLSDADH